MDNQRVRIAGRERSEKLELGVLNHTRSGFIQQMTCDRSTPSVDLCFKRCQHQSAGSPNQTANHREHHREPSRTTAERASTNVWKPPNSKGTGSNGGELGRCLGQLRGENPRAHPSRLWIRPVFTEGFERRIRGGSEKPKLWSATRAPGAGSPCHQARRRPTWKRRHCAARFEEGVESRAPSVQVPTQ